MNKLPVWLLFFASTPVLSCSSALDSVDYFPLAVGNQWQYACSVEGEKAFEKKLTIHKAVTIAGKPGYQATYIVNGSPAELYFWEDVNHIVHRSYTASGDLDEVIISRAAKIGDQYGELRVTREAMQTSLATGDIKTLVAENFDFESPHISSEKRNEWRGLFYANKIGLVVEADGLGGDCVLKNYSLGGTKK